MYLRRCYRNKDGKRQGYWALVESYRSSRGPWQRVAAYLGEMDAAGRLGIHQQAAGAAAIALRSALDPRFQFRLEPGSVQSPKAPSAVWRSLRLAGSV